MKQINFGFLKDYKKEFGGSLLVGKRKPKRPLSHKYPTHLILKSTGKSYFNSSNKQIEKIIRNKASKCGIKLYDIAMNWSHIHLLMQVPNRETYLKFIRTVTAEIVSYLSRKLNKNLKGLFDLRPYTKIVTWGRQLKEMLSYIELNQMESLGLINRKKKPKPTRKINLKKIALT